MDKGYIVFFDEQGTSGIYCIWDMPDKADWLDSYPTEDNESDSPYHCEVCHRPLYGSLTDDGVQYVLEYIINAVLDWDISKIDGDTLPWYANCPGTEITKDWALQIQDCNLDEHEQELVDFFLDRVPDTLYYSEDNNG